MKRELELPPEPNPSRLSSLAPFVGPGIDQLPFKLRKSAQHSQHQSTMRGCGVGPGVSQQSKSGASPRHAIEHVEQIASRASQPIKASDEENIASASFVRSTITNSALRIASIIRSVMR